MYKYFITVYEIKLLYYYNSMIYNYKIINNFDDTKHRIDLYPKLICVFDSTTLFKL